jgi:hypothetical protein
VLKLPYEDIPQHQEELTEQALPDSLDNAVAQQVGAIPLTDEKIPSIVQNAVDEQNCTTQSLPPNLCAKIHVGSKTAIDVIIDSIHGIKRYLPKGTMEKYKRWQNNNR